MSAVLGEEELRLSTGLRRFADLLWMEQHKPDDPTAESGEEILKRIIRSELRRPRIEIGNRDGGGDGDKWKDRIITVLLGITATLIAAGVIGGIAMYGQMMALNSRMDRVEKLVE